MTCRPKYQLGQQTFLSTTTTMPCKAVQDGNQKDGDKKKLKVMFFGTDEFALGNILFNNVNILFLIPYFIIELT